MIRRASRFVRKTPKRFVRKTRSQASFVHSCSGPSPKLAAAHSGDVVTGRRCARRKTPAPLRTVGRRSIRAGTSMSTCRNGRGPSGHRPRLRPGSTPGQRPGPEAPSCRKPTGGRQAMPLVPPTIRQQRPSRRRGRVVAGSPGGVMMRLQMQGTRNGGWGRSEARPHLGPPASIPPWFGIGSGVLSLSLERSPRSRP